MREQGGDFEASFSVQWSDSCPGIGQAGGVAYVPSTGSREAPVV